MEFDRLKTAWLQQSFGANPLGSAAPGSRSVQFLRASLVRDVQRSEELQRFIFCPLFALVFGAAAFVLMPAGGGRIATFLLAAALASDGVVGAILLTRRYGAPATSTMLDFVRRERNQVQTRIRVERYARILMACLFAAALVIFFAMRPAGTQIENAFESMGTMGVMTAFLAFVWLRAKSRTREFNRLLDRYLQELSE
jgi:hypothetical protein